MSTVKSRCAVVHCFGLPGSGKSQLVLQRAQMFRDKHANGLMINYRINIKRKSVANGLKDLVRDMTNNKFLPKELAQSIIVDLEQYKAGRLIEVLFESTASVLIIIDHLENNNELLRDLIRCTETKSIAHTSSLFYVWVVSRQQYPLHSEKEIQEMIKNKDFSYITKEVHGFNEEEATQYLCQGQRFRECNKTDAVTIFKRFSGLPLMLETTKKYCLQYDITFANYLDQLSTLRLATLLDDEMEAQTKEYEGDQHLFYKIIDPIIGENNNDSSDLQWDYLACLWHLDFLAIHKIVWKSFYREFFNQFMSDAEIASDAEPDNQVTKLMRHLSERSSCRILRDGTMQFKPVVALSFSVTRRLHAKRRSETFNSLEKTIKVMCQVLKELQKSNNPKDLQSFFKHVQKLQLQAQKEESGISSETQHHLAIWISICGK